VVARVRDDDGRSLYVVKKDLKHVGLRYDPGAEGWALHVPHCRQASSGLFGAQGKGQRELVDLSGPVAIRAAGAILPKVNSWGGTSAQVKNAVELVEETRVPERLFARVAEFNGHSKLTMSGRLSHNLKKMDANVRLALAMAAHEESERRALEGELQILEAAWRDAEEIASIADRLLIPERVENLLNKFRREVRHGPLHEDACADLAEHDVTR
jgi:hypothetical protein